LRSMTGFYKTLVNLPPAKNIGGPAIELRLP
jgi:hypothetical protein